MQVNENKELINQTNSNKNQIKNNNSSYSINDDTIEEDCVEQNINIIDKNENCNESFTHSNSFNNDDAKYDNLINKTNEETIDEELIEKSIIFINEKANETLYKGSIEIGDYILKNFFDNDIKLASSRNPRKAKSYKALCEHKELAVPYSTLTIMVRVAAQEKFFQENKINTNKLSYTHKADLIRLKNTPRKIEIVNECIEKSLSTRQLNKLVTDTRKKIVNKNKDNQEESAFQNIFKVESLLNRTLKAELITDLNKLKNMRSKTRKDLRVKTSELLEQMTQTAKECKKLLKNLDKIEKDK